MSLQETPIPVNGTSDLVESSTLPTPHEQRHLQTKPAKSTSKMAQDTKMPDDIMAHEDEWVGWDGPVWCSRFGRFENQEDAAHDDNYDKAPGSPTYQDRGLHRCEKSTCRVPSEHRSYVSDIKRRIEPMSRSLIQLEHQVQELVHHFAKDGQTFARTGRFHDDRNGGAIPVHHGEMGSPNFREPIAHSGEDEQRSPTPTPLNHGTEHELSHPRHAHYKEGYNQEGPPVGLAEFKENYNQEWPHYEHVKAKHTEPMEQTIKKLEGQVQSLSRQMKRLVDGGKDGEEADTQRP